MAIVLLDVVGVFYLRGSCLFPIHRCTANVGIAANNPILCTDHQPRDHQSLAIRFQLLHYLVANRSSGIRHRLRVDTARGNKRQKIQAVDLRIRIHVFFLHQFPDSVAFHSKRIADEIKRTLDPAEKKIGFSIVELLPKLSDLLRRETRERFLVVDTAWQDPVSF